MPFKSQARRRKFAELVVEGKMLNKAFEEWNGETGAAKVPERVKAKPSAGSKKRTMAIKARRDTR